jgi:hypothetical protein
MPGFLEDKLYLDFGSEYRSALARLAAHVHALDRQRVMERIAARDPVTLSDVKDILRFAGWRDAIVLGSRDWGSLTGLLRRHNVDVIGDRLSILDPISRRKTDVK